MNRVGHSPLIPAMAVGAQALAITQALKNDDSIQSDNSAQSDDSVGTSNAPFATSYDDDEAIPNLINVGHALKIQKSSRSRSQQGLTMSQPATSPTISNMAINTILNPSASPSRRIIRLSTLSPSNVKTPYRPTQLRGLYLRVGRVCGYVSHFGLLWWSMRLAVSGLFIFASATRLPSPCLLLPSF